MLNNEESYLKGRGAQGNINNKFQNLKYSLEHIEGLDEPFIDEIKTEFIKEYPKKIISESNSPDLSFVASVNPYHGCEHGCIYCYARNSHEYWGFDAGLDFESKIIIKPDAAKLLEQQLNKPNYQPKVILLSGNTDCYQPAERKFKITRSLLEVLLKYKHPVSIITKNNLILRDLDLLKELNKHDLLHVNISITSLDEDIRLKLEPRTVTGKGRLKVMEKLVKEGIPVRAMVAPIIPGLNSHEIVDIIKASSEHGVTAASFTIVRLNGAIGEIFTDWVLKAFPDKAEKVLNQIKSCHGGSLNDSRWGKRISGDGLEAEVIHRLFNIAIKKYMPQNTLKPQRLDLFKNSHNRQISLF
ncbi:PA0069 family radical SAM protein [Pedobacter aquae]|uniref:PA0069 family radical SAM protein n=1 Tax=Pedobacter aquae TaxID=2605747 RepID=A0A5C0VI84_9SPHI|nr:PA0069 family radical SAM protein [Pedobacter aquae]QEK52395.1 PA0069 family radical SAM protein [Pedobacter aquae]